MPIPIRTRYDDLARRYPKVAPVMDAAKTEVLAFAAFPREHWRKIWSTNPLERLNKEIKRRARVVEIFPDEAAVIRLVGAVLTDTHDEWVVDERRYLSEASMAKLAIPTAILTPSPPSKAVTGRHRDHLKAHHSAGLLRFFGVPYSRACRTWVTDRSTRTTECSRSTSLQRSASNSPRPCLCWRRAPTEASTGGRRRADLGTIAAATPSRSCAGA